MAPQPPPLSRTDSLFCLDARRRSSPRGTAVSVEPICPRWGGDQPSCRRDTEQKGKLLQASKILSFFLMGWSIPGWWELNESLVCLFLAGLLESSQSGSVSRLFPQGDSPPKPPGFIGQIRLPQPGGLILSGMPSIREVFRTVLGTCNTKMNGFVFAGRKKKKKKPFLFSENRFASIPSSNQWLFFPPKANIPNTCAQ